MTSGGSTNSSALFKAGQLITNKTILLLLLSTWASFGAETKAQSSRIESLANERGFSIETHQVITRDKYILHLHRIVDPLRVLAGEKGVIIIQHGILCASPFFLINSNSTTNSERRETKGALKDNNVRPGERDEAKVGNSLALTLTHLGYDVWLPNFRGTKYSSNHLTFGARSNRYWDFNVDALIEHDLASYVAYILNKTNRPTSGYTFIGHSLGATVGLGSLLVHANSPITSKLDCSILMSPVASTQFMGANLIRLFKLATLVYADPAPFPGDEFSLIADQFARHVCSKLPGWCLTLANSFIGAKHERASNHLDDELEFQNLLQVFIMMMDQSISVQMLKHIVQVHATGRLGRFNYGPARNQAIYGSPLAPVYNLSQIRQPKLRLAIVSAQSDAISTSGEIDWISKQVHDKVHTFQQIIVQANPFNHMDLVMSRDAGELVNRPLIEFIERNKCSY